MSQDFKFKFDRMRENDPGGERATPDKEVASSNYDGIGHARNICFVWMDGRKLFLNYSYLVSCDYAPDEQSITLSFTSHTVVLQGLLLEKLFDELMSHLPRIIICSEARYNSLIEESQYAVNEITAEKAT